MIVADADLWAGSVGLAVGALVILVSVLDWRRRHAEPLIRRRRAQRD